MTFECLKCHAMLDREAFYANRRKPRGLQDYCKPCYKAYQAAWRTKIAAAVESFDLSFFRYGVEIEVAMIQHSTAAAA